MPVTLLDRHDKAYDWFIKSCRQSTLMQGILVNYFDALEPPRVLEALASGECTPDVPTPPVYCLGPLLLTPAGGNRYSSCCMESLDAQPAGSVVYLCFGSQGTFSTAQIKEIATGLENSRQRFLWVIHSTQHMQEPDINGLLPEGFSGRTSWLGMVVKSWAPQVAVLNHGAVGRFVTHRRWNSMLESVCAGGMAPLCRATFERAVFGGRDGTGNGDGGRGRWLCRCRCSGSKREGGDGIRRGEDVKGTR
ncbi:hypothetical protein AMTRI_Chr01g130120 [Amborella trichopoda]